ncbi:phosphotransferase [Heyndrickxia oleronia]|uniref:phosphotransferase n=1 Tax=Heyndrickxia oleronia TaxID=38875 RepID=UPI001AFFA218|nr:phosphotransferase [Heyndrickxia oleronia]GIN37233.1 hypothetical protein J19TS1_01820 [Heyndrickxia oleronia]
MGREDFTILNEYSIRNILSASNMNQGNTSSAKLINTSQDKYILRKIKDKKQAITEYLISKKLLKHQITSEILLSKNNLPFVIKNSGIYNLQRYIEHYPIKIEEINFSILGETIAFFHSEAVDIKGIYEQEDRFLLNRLWKEVEHSIQSIEMKIKKQLVELINECFNYKHKSNCYIHSDLGIWNLLINKNKIYLIDFGEVRKGNNHFDIAAILSSTLKMNDEDYQIITNINEFRNGYLKKFNDFDWSILRENLNLWFIRGMLALIINKGINQATQELLEKIMHQRNKLDGILMDHIKKKR